MKKNTSIQLYSNYPRENTMQIRRVLSIFLVASLSILLLWVAINSPANVMSAPKMVAKTTGSIAPSQAFTDTLTIRPLSDLYVESEGPPQMINITPNQATLTFVSNIPVACSVIYGTDDTYGMIAQDPNMAGGAITDHNPLLVGLEPDTEYFYRLQGFDANGVMYISDPATFRTLSEAEEVEPTANLAALSAGAQVIAVSSNFGSAANDRTWGANSAIDENPSTAWSSNGDGDNAYIEIQLAEPAQPTSVEVWTRFMTNNTAQIFEFTLTAEDITLGPFSLTDATQAYSFTVDFGLPEVTSIRLDVVESNGGNTGLVELAVYAETVATQSGIVPDNEDTIEIYLPVVR